MLWPAPPCAAWYAWYSLSRPGAGDSAPKAIGGGAAAGLGRDRVNVLRIGAHLVGGRLGCGVRHVGEFLDVLDCEERFHLLGGIFESRLGSGHLQFCEFFQAGH
jgi:hypothetical protein